MKQPESGFSVAIIALGIRLDSKVLNNITLGDMAFHLAKWCTVQ